MKQVVQYMKLYLPRTEEQIQVRRDLALLGQQLEIEAAQLFRSPLNAEVVAAQSIKAAGKSIGLLTAVPRTSFRSLAPQAIDLVRRYFYIAQKVVSESQIEFRREQFERLVVQLQP